MVYTARCCAERGYATVISHPSVCGSVCPSDCDVQLFFTQAEVLISLTFLLGLTPTWAIWSNGNTPNIS